MKRHAVLMLICCAIPLLLIAALSALGILGTWGLYGLILLCPLMHLLMMRHGHAHSKKSTQEALEKHRHD